MKARKTFRAFFLCDPSLVSVTAKALKAGTQHVVTGSSWTTDAPFRVMGGYVFATGVLTITVAATSFRERRSGAAIGALIGGTASIGLMTAVNFIIGSDFKRVLLGMALIWAISLGLFWFEAKNANCDKSAANG